MPHRSRETTSLTIHLTACWLHRHIFFLGPQFTRFQTVYLRKHLSCIPSTTVDHIFPFFAYSTTVLVPPTPLRDKVSRFILSWHRGTLNSFVIRRMIDAHLQIGLMPYIPFIRELSKEDPDLGIIVIEVTLVLSLHFLHYKPPIRYSRSAIG